MNVPTTLAEIATLIGPSLVAIAPALSGLTNSLVTLPSNPWREASRKPR